MGYVVDGDTYEKLYEYIQESGFILVFREHNSAMLGKKKGNVDTDIVLNVMKCICLKEEFDKIILASSDGDYKALVGSLIEQEKFEKTLFPNKNYASSLYKQLEPKYFDYLNSPSVRQKIEYKDKEGTVTT